ISSSGHLALTQYFLGFKEPPVAFDVVLHVGTLLAVLIYYRRDLLAMGSTLFRPKELIAMDWNSDHPGKLMLFLIIACIPTALMGFLLKSRVESAFSDMSFVGLGFLLSGVIMIVTIRRRTMTRTLMEMNATDAFLIGTMQGVALFPGVSRSGSTISAALLLGLKPELAGRFSFLLSIPAIVGATALEAGAIQTQLRNGMDLFLYGASGIIAGVVGYLSIGPMIRILQASRFHYFAFYCWLIGSLLLIYLWQTNT
ncbi:MAG TPA: undecaprenyl-diphosphate phosphatase, partial [Acidobacteriota bacterium]|nr:undecaprenyl-diphosphate phosphatase [Acidobacteriota bacterium]